MASKTESIIITTVILLLIGSFIIGLQAPPHIPILFGFMLLIGFAFWKRAPWTIVEKGIRDGISSGIPSIFIFILVGVLISIWMASGTIPTMMVFGFSMVSDKFFLATVFVVCTIVGTSIGSAFTTAATVGIAFIGIGTALGYDLPLIAGAIISGAFFGDKMSPLSDTTNLAPAVSGVDMFEHIRNMLWTTLPAFIISFILFLIFGHETNSSANFHEFQSALEKQTTISWVTLLPVAIVLILALKRVPAIPTLLAGIVSGIVLLFVFHPDTTMQSLVSIIQDGFKSDTGIKEIDRLLTRGGIQSMMWSVSLILLSLGMGGLLYEFGMIEQLIQAIAQLVRSTGKLICSTAFTAIGINILLGEQYLSIILTGRAFGESFDKLGLERKNLSRVLEDAGTVVNPLIPWSVSGIFLSGILGVSVMEYLPFTFFCLLCPVITMLLGFTGIGISKVNPLKQQKAV
ncbi:Na+/H+ antiporter NhaC [Bacillus sp. 165]|uniref:Na+/H+ antiporter NhaC n=1 Tax=Bacillus sp. 165 TaxID=1529117 RepID=UPI001ADB9AD8|nr:Na+/H+ antiporter NhaC [Bacillus sp. 165]